MLEIEMKFRVDDSTAYERLLRETLGVEPGAPTTESDVFFTNEALGFPNRGKSLRIRRRGNYLAATFKGPRLDSETKTREEIELTLVDEAPVVDEETTRRVDQARADWIKFYGRLGFLPYGEVVKTRRRARATYEERPFEITLDYVEGLGFFTELETTAEKSEFDAAKGVVLSLAQKLGLRDAVTQSYLSLVFSKDEYLRSCDSK
ncbi:MAG: class IV adenylate cyclase [Thermoguttaceae bacterium]|nr:class IV adenylate cyclase [Thermoguttaceae bacterium]MBR5757547.1 class IV adenylate cyclase [Thermoguttaceae bacterium]